MNETSPNPRRRHDLDRLRIFACYLLLLFHVAMVFNPAPFYHIRNADVSFFMLVLCGFIALWHMPLLFVLAGWSAFASLDARGGRGFLGERVRKLAIPLVAGCVLLAPTIKYFELRSGFDANYKGLHVSAAQQESFETIIPEELPVAAPFDEGYLEFLPSFFTQLDRFTWSHLWFLAYLFTFTLLYRPLFAWLRRRRGELAEVGSAWVYAPILPLALIQITMRPHWPGLQNLYDDWANFAYYSTFLLLGFLLARHPAFEKAVHREWKRALGIALASMLVLLSSILGLIESPALLLGGTAVAGWCFIVALLGFTHARLAHPSPALSALTESAFPVYLLHQFAIVLVGYWLIQLPVGGGVGVALKFVLLLAAATATTLGLYQFVVRPIAPLRFLFGMKPRRRSALATNTSLPRPTRLAVEGQGRAS